MSLSPLRFVLSYTASTYSSFDGCHRPATLTVLTNVCAGDAHILLDITPAIKYPKTVIPAKAGIQENTLGIILPG